jgi:hypothetical protein
MNNIILNIHDYLQQISSAKDQSITRLISSLEKRKGFGRIELLNAPSKPIALSIQHDGSIIASQKIIQITQTIADNLNRIFGHLLVKVSDLYVNHDLQKVGSLFKNCSGVTHVLTERRGWIDLEFNRYITRESSLIDCINQNKYYHE